MLESSVALTGRSLGSADRRLLGYNLDWMGDVPAGVLSQRLENPTFLGPADSQTGLAPPWVKLLEFSGGMRFELEPGGNMAGGPAQRLHVWDMRMAGNPGMVQPHRWVRKGETLRVVLWARCQDHPVRVNLGFRHRALAGPVYGSTEVVVDRTHFHRYEARFAIASDDEDCLFSFFLREPGIVCLDRIIVEPVDEPIFRTDTLAAMAELSPGALRRPAGCLSSNYHWRRGTGPEQLRYDDFDMTFHWGMNYTRGTDEYLEPCQRLNATPHFVVNIGTGTPGEAADWAAYVADWHASRDVAPPEVIWQIGNEHVGGHEIGHMQAGMYPQVLRDYVPGIRQNYPRPLIVSAQCDDAWAKAILTEAPDLVDMISLHFYACHCDFNLARSGAAFVGDAQRFARTIDEFGQVIASHRVAMRLAITEWGAFRAESHTDRRFYDPMNVWSAMYVAAMLNHMCRRAPKVGLANAYSLVNLMPAIVARGPHVLRTTTHQVMQLWRPVLPSDILEVTLDGPTFKPPRPDNRPDCKDAPWTDADDLEPEPWVDVLMGRQDGKTWAMLTNRHPTEPVQVQLPAELADATVTALVAEAGGEHYDHRTGRLTGRSIRMEPASHARIGV